MLIRKSTLLLIGTCAVLKNLQASDEVVLKLAAKINTRPSTPRPGDNYHDGLLANLDARNDFTPEDVGADHRAMLKALGLGEDALLAFGVKVRGTDCEESCESEDGEELLLNKAKK